MTKKFIIIVLSLGIILRLLLSAFTFHQDITAFDLGGRLIASGNILNLYDYLGTLPGDNPIAKNFPADFLIYPPAIYLYQGIHAFIWTNLFQPEFLQNFLVDFPKTINTTQLYFHLLLLKLPYFLFDIATAFLIAGLFTNSKQKKWAFALWIFNPVTFFATFMMGQFDIIPVFFTMLALVFLQKRDVKPSNLYLAALSLGLGAAFKIYPLFLLVPLAFLGKNIGDKLKVFIVGLIPYVIFVLPFINSKGFRSSALVAGQTLKSFYAQIPISGGEAIILFLGFLLFFYLIFYYQKNISFDNIWQNFLIILLLFFIFTHYHPQWFLWLTPFLIISLVKSQFKTLLPIILMLMSFKGLLFFFDQGLTFGLFAPINGGFYRGLTVWEIIGKGVDYNLCRSVLQTIFAASAFYLIYLYFPKKQSED